MARRPRSPAQRAASRSNGKRSKGPTTERGKAQSKRNALKHGLRAESVSLVAEAADPGLQTLIGEVRAQVGASDLIEIEIADGMALALWRLRRTARMEEELIEDSLSMAPEMGDHCMLYRDNVGTALPLLLRYRTQAVTELTRLHRLLRVHRGQPDDPSAYGDIRKLEAAGPANDNAGSTPCGSGSALGDL